jgi:hypothetical protein
VSAPNSASQAHFFQKRTGIREMTSMSGMPMRAYVACFQNPPKKPLLSRNESTDELERTMTRPTPTRKSVVQRTSR